jgi:hypothetical protein
MQEHKGSANRRPGQQGIGDFKLEPNFILSPNHIPCYGSFWEVEFTRCVVYQTLDLWSKIYSQAWLSGTLGLQCYKEHMCW